MAKIPCTLCNLWMPPCVRTRNTRWTEPRRTVDERNARRRVYGFRGSTDNRRNAFAYTYRDNTAYVSFRFVTVTPTWRRRVPRARDTAASMRPGVMFAYVCFRSSVMYKGAILNIQSNSKKASSCPDIYNNNSTLTVTSEPDSVSIRSSRGRFTRLPPPFTLPNMSRPGNGLVRAARCWTWNSGSVENAETRPYKCTCTVLCIPNTRCTRFYRCPTGIVLSK